MPFFTLSLRRRTFLLFLVLSLPSMACALLQGPQQLNLPPPPTPLPVVQDLPADTVINPQSNLIAGADADILNMVRGVSQQNLVAYVQTLEGFHTRNTFSATNVEGRGVGAARRWIFNEFIRVGNGRLLVEADEFPYSSGGVTTSQQNIVATLPGRDPNAGVIVLSAHYDSRTFDPNDGSSFAPGANDNGSGVAVLLESARLLSAQEWNQTIVFVAFAAEEQGRYGSQHFVTQMLLQGMKINAVFNFDIVGGRPGIPQLVRAITPGDASSATRELVRYMDLVRGFYVPQFGLEHLNAEDREGRWGDHLSFLHAGIPAVRLTESQEDPTLQHNSGDVSAVMDFNYLRQVTQLAVAVAATAAGAPTRPSSPTIAAMSEPGAYLISWLPDPNAAGYVISFRPMESENYPTFSYVLSEQSGNVALTNLDTSTNYAVSMAALTRNGRISFFSPEVVIGN
ncbi:MAG TPA: M20/M25/M40 family metallo-hydrolase [Chloroflexota bacterium]|nr:M20/M25/M40 family metallo-hydrolase [Chloroflexota bacterium]